jgi:signal transduction histidine kinase
MMPASAKAESEELLINLVHDLRQPLANLEASAYVLRKWLPDLPAPAVEHIRTIERQVAQAVLLLNDATSDLRRLRSQSAEGLELTKSASAAVT